ncbi:MAG: FmdB family zinc ribbon protein [Candidatus Thorarchaeota archaeon]|jgi:putative FmdB family regulatory protein
MIYPYVCRQCSHAFDVIKSYKNIDDPEQCPECGDGDPERVLAPSALHGIDEWDYNHYNHGLGCWTKGTKHAEKIAKTKGFEPVGNESIESIDKRNEADKARRRKEAWDSV